MPIIQSAFQKQGAPFLKGALHVHTTRSDGKGTPEEVLRLYASKGYGFVAITDHNIYNSMNYAPDTGLLIIPGTERDINFPDNGHGLAHTFHTVVLGRSAERGNIFVNDQRFDRPGAVSSQFEFQPYLDEIHSHNNVTFLCHPQWSGTPAREFDQIRGHFAMEIWNSGCMMECDMDTNAMYWDELLAQGKRWWGVAVDDGHDMNQHGHGWVNVAADKDVDSVIAALESGAFYSSCGPEIYDFRVEDDKAVIECSPCEYAGFAYLRKPSALTWDKDGNGVTRAEYRIPKGANITYLRGVVRDAQGRRAWTNPIFFD